MAAKRIDDALACWQVPRDHDLVGQVHKGYIRLGLGLHAPLNLHGGGLEQIAHPEVVGGDVVSLSPGVCVRRGLYAPELTDR